MIQVRGRWLGAIVHYCLRIGIATWPSAEDYKSVSSHSDRPTTDKEDSRKLFRAFYGNLSSCSRLLSSAAVDQTFSRASI